MIQMEPDVSLWIRAQSDHPFPYIRHGLMINGILGTRRERARHVRSIVWQPNSPTRRFSRLRHAMMSCCS